MILLDQKAKMKKEEKALTYANRNQFLKRIQKLF